MKRYTILKSKIYEKGGVLRCQRHVPTHKTMKWPPRGNIMVPKSYRICVVFSTHLIKSQLVAVQKPSITNPIKNVKFAIHSHGRGAMIFSRYVKWIMQIGMCDFYETSSLRICFNMFHMRLTS